MLSLLLFSQATIDIDTFLSRHRYKSISLHQDHFIDKEFGGRLLDGKLQGRPAEHKKTIYALAFAIFELR